MAASAAIYTRISDDPEGRGVNVATQEKDCRRFADELGLTVAEVFCDNSRTAADPTKPRPEFERMLQAVEAGEFGVVIAYKSDRLARLVTDLDRVMIACKSSGTALRYVQGLSDFETAQGRFMAKQGALLGEYEVDQIRERVLRKMRANAEDGGRLSGYPGFGFQADGVTVDEDEALLIKEAAQRVLAGESLASIARSWNERGLRTKAVAPSKRRGAAGKGREAKEWRASTIRRFLLAPRTAGLRVHKGEIVGKAAWPAIVDEATWKRVGKILTRDGRSHGQSRNAHLLTGIVRCGKEACGETLNHGLSGRKVPSYRCRHCFGTVVYAEPLEKLVQRLVIRGLDRPELAKALAVQMTENGTTDLAAETARIEAELKEVAGDYANREITMAEWRVVRGVLKDRLTEIHRELERSQRDPLLAKWAGKGGGLQEAWSGLPVTEQKRLIESLFVELKVQPAKKGVGASDVESRLVETWRY